jgi:hypothetical protein
MLSEIEKVNRTNGLDEGIRASLLASISQCLQLRGLGPADLPAVPAADVWSGFEL